MAKNIYDFLTLYPETKMFFAAHNMHVAAAETNFAKWMGSWLKGFFKSSYYRLAITVGDGYYTAAESLNNRIYKPYPLQKPFPGTAEHYFEKVNKENFILSLANIKNHDAAWLNTQIGFRDVGFVQHEIQFYNVPLRDYYNGIVYIRNTTPTHLLTKLNKE